MIQSDSLSEYVDEIATSALLGPVCVLTVGPGRFENLIRWASGKKVAAFEVASAPSASCDGHWTWRWTNTHLEIAKCIARPLSGDDMKILLFQLFQ